MTFRKFQSNFSRTVGQIVLGSAGLVYANQLWMSSFEKVASIGIAAFGVIAALAALCFTMSPCMTTEEDRHPALFAGEKFFHASILLIQTIFLKFAGESFCSMQFIQSKAWLHSLLNGLTSLASSLTGASATWFSIYAFDALNDFFWLRHTRTNSGINTKKKKQ